MQSLQQSGLVQTGLTLGYNAKTNNKIKLCQYVSVFVSLTEVLRMVCLLDPSRSSCCELNEVSSFSLLFSLFSLYPFQQENIRALEFSL